MSKTSLIRKAGTDPSAEETTISPSTPASRARYGRKRTAIRRRYARRTAGSAGRSGGSIGSKSGDRPLGIVSQGTERGASRCARDHRLSTRSCRIRVSSRAAATVGCARSTGIGSPTTIRIARQADTPPRQGAPRPDDPDRHERNARREREPGCAARPGPPAHRALAGRSPPARRPGSAPPPGRSRRNPRGRARPAPRRETPSARPPAVAPELLLRQEAQRPPA